MTTNISRTGGALLPGPDRQTIRVRVTERGVEALAQAGEAGL